MRCRWQGFLFSSISAIVSVCSLTCYAQISLEYASPTERQSGPPAAIARPALSRRELITDLQLTRLMKASTYEVRTRYMDSNGQPKYINRLIREDSPYLLQHAHNPVNWFAWGDEAFEVAQRENKPVFLSIGYSTCHWCHVMEEESFDDEGVAEILNRDFICIKVDREQRPDLDEIYMTAVQMFAGRGGWPMSSFLTPQGEPFYGGTYFPQAQFKALLSQVNQAWTTQESAVREDAARVARQVDEYMSSALQAARVDQAVLGRWRDHILASYDEHSGGFSAAPKFPNETYLLLLLDQLKRSHPLEPKLHQALRHTLDRMAQGGIYDQVGGGFHRYSTDAEWLVPHFEKMLYNQALLGRVYTESVFLTGSPFHRQIAKEIFDYVLRDMLAKSGGFFSATDADSEGEEGKFFLWDQAELQKVLTSDEYALVASLYSVSAGGNFEGRNLFHLNEVPKQYWADDAALWLGRLAKIKQKLYRVREKRIHPLRDEKIITAWNGMMITALVKGEEVLGDARYLAAAKVAAEFLWQHHFDKAGHLSRVSLNGAVSIEGTQEDYAYFAEALLALYRGTADAVWLTRAQRVVDEMIARFMDAENGGFYLSAKQVSGPLISRIKSTRDGAIPSGNSVALAVLVRLVNETEVLGNKRALKTTLAFLSGGLMQQGSSQSYALRALSDSLAGEVDSTISLAGGHVHGSIVWVGGGENKDASKESAFEIRLRIDAGWHINADKVAEKNLIPTRVDWPAGRQQAEGLRLIVAYPDAQLQTLGFQQQPLSLLTGDVVVKGRIRGAYELPLTLGLTLQACDDEHCLPPETRELILGFSGE